jgi:hypothetical protein
MQRAGRYSLKTGPGSEDLRQRAAKQGHRSETRRRREDRKTERNKWNKRNEQNPYLVGDWRRIASKGAEGGFLAASFCLPYLLSSFECPTMNYVLYLNLMLMQGPPLYEARETARRVSFMLQALMKPIRRLNLALSSQRPRSRRETLDDEPGWTFVLQGEEAS